MAGEAGKLRQDNADRVAFAGGRSPGIAGMFSSFRSDTPQLFVDIDRTKCKSLGVPLSDVFEALQVFLGGTYVNDFNEFGRTWQVNVQADAPFRRYAENVQSLKVRNAQGKMLPLGTLATIEDIGGPVLITRYNMFPAAPINGASVPGLSSGETIATVDSVAKSALGGGMEYELHHVVLFGEYLHANYGSNSFQLGGVTHTADMDADVFRAGIKFKGE